MYKLLKIFSIILFFLLYHQPVHSQRDGVDSMEKLLKQKGLPDSTRLSTLLQLGWNFSFINATVARKYLYDAVELAKKYRDENSIGTGFSYIGTSYLNLDQFDSAMLFYKKAEKHFLKDTSADAKENVMVNRMSMGTVALQQGYHETAIRYYLDVVDQNMNHSAIPDWKNLLTAYANIGLVYNDLKQFDKALEYHTRALNISNKHPDELKKLVQVQSFIALDLLNLKKYNEVVPAIEKAENTAEKINTDYFFAIVYAIKGRYFNEINKYDSSIAASTKALRHAKAVNQKFQESNILYQLGVSNYMLGHYIKSRDYFLSALFINRKLKDKVREQATLNYLGKAYAGNNNFEAASKYFQEYIQLSDSLNKTEVQKKINEIENKYQSEKKLLQISSLKKDNAFQKSALKHRQAINAALVVVCILLLSLAGLFYFNFKNKNRLFKQNEALHQQKISEIENERKLAAVQSVIKGQEAERSRLARDLHDGVGGLLSGVKLSLSTMKGNVFLSEKNAQSINNIIGQLDQSIAELRRVSHNMMPEALIKFGLKEALENYCENINLLGKSKVKLQTYGMENRMDQNTEIVLYRIVQELLSNVIKYAEAENVLIQLTQESAHFTLTVEDDGKGFETSGLITNKGAGIANVKARAAYLNGLVDVHSAPGQGTSVTVEGNCI